MKIATRYDSDSPVMKMLGKQPFAQMIDYHELYEIKDIIKAHKEYERIFDISAFAYDVFMLGYIYGKRAERKRKKISWYNDI